MAFERVRQFFQRSTGKPAAKAVPVVPRTVAEIVERPATRSKVRFRVERVEDGVTYEAYAGNDGATAVLTWEAYLESDKAGVFTFMDGEHCRGGFTRDV